jgi:hypothetical protein
MLFGRWSSRNKDQALSSSNASTDAFGNPLADSEGPTVVAGLGGPIAGGLGEPVASGLGEPVASGLGEPVASGLDVGAVNQSGRVVLRQFSHDAFAAAAIVLGVKRGELARQLHQGQGRTIAEVAADAGVARQSVIDAVAQDTTMRLDAQAANGTISASQAEEAKSRVAAWAVGFADRRRGEPGTGPGAS